MEIDYSPIIGKFKDFAHKFGVSELTMMVFLDGVSDCLKIDNNIEEITNDSLISLDYDADKFHKKLKDLQLDIGLDSNNIDTQLIVRKILQSEYKKQLYYYIHINDISSASAIIRKYCKCNDIDIKEIIQEYKDAYIKDPEIAQINAKERARQTAPVPRCPMCGSTNIQKISNLNRTASIVGFGILSKKIGKQWQCNNPKCKHLW